MKRRAAPGLGFWMTFALNLIFQSEWLGLAIVMAALHILLQLPILLAWICLSIWVVWSLALTLLADWLSATSHVPPTPGSKRASERIKQNKNN